MVMLSTLDRCKLRYAIGVSLVPIISDTHDGIFIAENSRPGLRPSTSLSLRSLYVGKHCANAPAHMSSTPPKHMGFHFIGDIGYPPKICFDKMKLNLCQSIHSSGE